MKKILIKLIEEDFIKDINDDALKEFLNVSYSNKNNLNKSSSQFQSKLFKKTHEILNSRKNDTNVSIGNKIEDILKFIKNEQRNVKFSIQNNILPPTELITEDIGLYGLLIRNTFTKDYWYEQDEKNTHKFDLISTYMIHIWNLEMYYRLWIRYKRLNENDAEIYIKGKEFLSGSYFPVPKDGLEIPIIDWIPELVFDALNLLRNGRDDMQLFKLKTKYSIQIFKDYVTALMDKIMLMLTGVVTLKRDYISDNTNRSIWLKEYKLGVMTNDDDIQLLKRSNEDDNRDMSRLIREHIENLHQQKLKQLGSKYSTEKKQVFLSKRERKKLIEEYVKKQEEDVDYTAEINSLKYQLSIETDTEEKNLIQMEIDKLKHQETLNFHKNVSELENQKNNEETIYNNLFKDLENNFTPSTSNFEISSPLSTDYIITPKWIAEHYCLVDQINSWHLNSFRLFLKFALSDELKLIKDNMRNAVLESILTLDESKLLVNCRKWIIEKLITFSERKYYRSMASSLNDFTPLHAGKLTRGNKFAYMDDFPNSINRCMKPEGNNYYYECLAFFTYWYMKQSFSILNVNLTIFLWDVEEEYLSMNRMELIHPVITKIGYDWHIVTNWITNNNFEVGKRNFNTLNCGPSLIDCFSNWLIIMKDYDSKIEENKILIIDRKSKRKYNIKEFIQKIENL